MVYDESILFIDYCFYIYSQRQVSPVGYQRGKRNLAAGETMNFLWLCFHHHKILLILVAGSPQWILQKLHHLRIL